MKNNTILLIGIGIHAIAPAFGQGYINFSWFGNGTQGIQVGPCGTVPSQLPGWYLAGDYSVEAFMAAGANQPESSLVPIASTKTNFFGSATTSASGSPQTDGSGLWAAGKVDTGLAVGTATIEVRAWYDPNHNTSYDQAIALNYTSGTSTLYNINLVTSADPNIQSLDSISFQAFQVGVCPEPSPFMLGCFGFAALLIFHRGSKKAPEFN